MLLKLVVLRTVPNMVVHWVDEREIWSSHNYTLYLSRDEGITFNKMADIGGSSLTCMLGKCRLLARAFRLGIRNLRKLESGTLLVIADRKIFRSENGEFKTVFHFRKGFGPLREGWCEDDKWNCYLGEYFLNNKRDTPINLLKSSDDGQTWDIIRSIHSIRHIHCVQYDPFCKKIWLGTGDRDNECSISFSKDEGQSWIKIGSGDQMFRTVSFLFTEDYVYWGSDAPTRQNYIYRYVRKSGNIEKLAAVDGPVNYSAILKNEKMLFATTAEGNSEGKSAEWDRKAHIWASEDGTHWDGIISWEKDIYPYELGKGRVYFPHGRFRDNIYFTTEALKKVDETLFCAKLCRKANDTENEK